MSKSHITPGKLVATGSIVPELHNVHSFLQPGYICEGRGQSSGIKYEVFAAITSVYQSIFGSKMKYAGLSYLGLDQPETAQKLLKGITFRPFIIELENITVFVSCLGKITISNTNKVGHNYAALGCPGWVVVIV
ncbi:uncharacterized protein OCT59_021552 [Rhizophagus irregularis]|uniref:uncharacterized protein n=1 Tax=Rhizophagus irregularis TaxID=588596 RepID=UPI00332AA3A3|nr:hypothetical protein OCT59_021552 [Rhizophagus irregularis]